MRYRHTFNLAVMVLLSLILIGQGHTAAVASWSPLKLSKPLPAAYPAEFQETGILRTVASPYRWVISGVAYKLDFSVKLHQLSGKSSTSLFAFKPGIELGFSHKDKLITEVWELPPGSIPRF